MKRRSSGSGLRELEVLEVDERLYAHTAFG